MTKAHYAAVEAADGRRLADWFRARGLELRPLSELHDRSLKRPDFEVYHEDRLVGRCELKSFGLGPWDWDNARSIGDGLLEFQASDTDPRRQCEQIHIRLSRSIVEAARQLEAYDPHHQFFWIVAIGNHDPVADLRDLDGILRGQDAQRCGRYVEVFYDESDNPERTRIKRYRYLIDVVIWLNGAHIAPKLNDSDPKHLQRLRELFDCPLTAP